MPNVFLRASASAALLGLACGTAGAQAADLEWSVSASLVQRKLVERTATGATLVTEEGPMARAGLRVAKPFGQGAAVAARIGLTGGDLDYNGQMQLTGTPLKSTTRHVEMDADVALRPFAPAAWGEGWVTLGRLENRRTIKSTPLTRALYERSSAVMVGALWRSPALAAVRGWDFAVEAEGQRSLQHRVHVDFYGLLSPNRLTLPGGQKNLVKLRLLGSTPSSPWEWALEWSRLSQEASGSVAARGFGLNLVVAQPELSVRDVSLRLARRF